MDEIEDAYWRAIDAAVAAQGRFEMLRGRGDPGAAEAREQAERAWEALSAAAHEHLGRRV